MFKKYKEFKKDVKEALSDIYKREDSRDKLLMVYLDERFPCIYRSFDYIESTGDRYRCMAMVKLNKPPHTTIIDPIRDCVDCQLRKLSK
jgi:hypothetical protein